MNCSRKTAILILIFFVFCGFILIYFFHRNTSPRDIESRNNNASRTSTDPTDSSWTRKGLAKNEARDNLSIPGSNEFASTRRQIRSLFRESEVDRTTLLQEFEFDSMTRYVLGVDTPSPEAIEKLRIELSKAAQKINDRFKDEYDQWVSDLEKHYNPYGYDGKQVTVIQIPKDEADEILAFTYNVNEFAGEPEKFSKADLSLNFGQVRIYPNDKSVLFRFREFIETPNKK